MLDTLRSEVVWRVLATHSIRQFPLHFPSRASPCDVTFQLDCNLEPFPRELLSSFCRNTQIPLSCKLRLFRFASPGALTLSTEADERRVLQDCRFSQHCSWSLCSFAIWNCVTGYPISDVSKKNTFGIDIFVNSNWVATRWQQYSTHLHTNSAQNNTINNFVWKAFWDSNP
jgi:hypothetical protein